MNIDWGAFGEVFGVSMGAGVGVVLVFAIGVALISARVPAGGQRAATPARPSTGGQRAATAARPSTGNQALAALCFLACALVVSYGLYLVIHK
jgi:hypothetical protein